MKRLLLDTHTFIWWDSDPTKLSATALAAICDPTNEAFLSVVSVWEMVIKADLGKLTLRVPLTDLIARQQANGLRIMTVGLAHVLAVQGLPTIHKDPFDRLLVAQANGEGCELVSDDQILKRYPVRLLW